MGAPCGVPISTCGHRVDVVDPVPGLPDMVYAANGATVVGGTVLGARFRHPERAAEAAGIRRLVPAGPASGASSSREFVNEGEGDLLVVGPAQATILAGTGFRTDPRAHAEAAAVLRRAEVVPLELVDPRYYHLDTALAVLDDGTTIAWLPEAFTPGRQAVLRERVPRRVVADAADAAVLGLNAVSDGRHVVPARPGPAAGRRARRARLRARPDRPVRAAQGRRRTEVLHVGGARVTATLPHPSMEARPTRPAATSRWSASTRRTTTTPCRSWSRTPRGPGSPTSRAGGTWTAWPGTPH